MNPDDSVPWGVSFPEAQIDPPAETHSRQDEAFFHDEYDRTSRCAAEHPTYGRCGGVKGHCFARHFNHRGNWPS